MEDWVGLVNLEGRKGGNMHDCAKKSGQYRHMAKFSIGALILFVLLTMVGDYDCLANGFVPFKLLSPGFAVFVVGVSHSDPSRAVGPPDKKYVSLGKEDGYIVATMGAPFTNGSGADIRVYEVGNMQGGRDERFDVFISMHSANWILVAGNVKNDSGAFLLRSIFLHIAANTATSGLSTEVLREGVLPERTSMQSKYCTRVPADRWSCGSSCF